MAYTIAFFGTKPYDEASFNDKNKEYGFELRYYKGHLNKHNVILTQNVDAVCIFVNDTADAEVLHMMADNGVKLLALRCAGYNDVDLKAAADCGITVVRVPAYSPYAVAEYTVALMLSLNRKIPRATWRTRDGNFSLHGLLGFDMYGKTVGIIGTGKIAKKLIMILRGFGMNVLAYDLYPDYNFAREHQVVYTTLDELYHSSDIISLHCPLTEQTKYLINDYSISKMKEGVMIINTGRGQLIHTNALIRRIEEQEDRFCRTGCVRGRRRILLRRASRTASSMMMYWRVCFPSTMSSSPHTRRSSPVKHWRISPLPHFRISKTLQAEKLWKMKSRYKINNKNLQ